MGIIATVVLNGLAIWIVQILVPGFSVSDGWLTYLLAGLVLGVLNFFIKPLLKILTAPLIIFTLGLFLVVVNMAVVWILDKLMDSIYIADFWTLFIATIALSIVNFLFNMFRKA